MNEKKFDLKGSVYVKGRPAYPKMMLEYLLDIKVITPDTIVADVGSGTGIFTSQIAPLLNIYTVIFWCYVIKTDVNIEFAPVFLFAVY